MSETLKIDKAMEDIRDVQLHQVKMLTLLDKLLQKEGIQYFAIGGTALGAIRHQGFIPWDDDIDLAMLRPDYEKFLKVQDKLPKNLFLISHKSNKNYPLFFPKILDKNTYFLDKSLKKYDIPRHVFVDIFPWDNISHWQKLRKKLRITNKRFKRTIYKKHGSLSDKAKYVMYKGLYLCKNSEYFYSKMTALLQESEKESTDLWGDASYNDVLVYDDIFPLRKVPFEDTHIYIPNQCEKYLQHKYGDYMKIPEVKDRINHSTLSSK